MLKPQTEIIAQQNMCRQEKSGGASATAVGRDQQKWKPVLRPIALQTIILGA
ncbi:hypothetical protein [Bradyrhizobium sp.]|uniref:hypothetical protein n=1 Tax=Bradyrhizobium sp. TaxID=376 RepID=UPI003C7081CD